MSSVNSTQALVKNTIFIALLYDELYVQYLLWLDFSKPRGSARICIADGVNYPLVRNSL